VIFTGQIQQGEGAFAPYRSIPVPVPRGVRELRVSYEVQAGSILDIGLADPRFSEFPAREGFRGWSGSARRSIRVAADGATPGYLPGEIQPGEWTVILGLAEVGPEGCRYRIEVTLETGSGSAVQQREWSDRSLGPAGWYPGDLQSHTHYSDARGSLRDLVQAAADRNLAFLAVTDHNTTSHHREIADYEGDMLLIPGEEITTYHGHANIWGLKQWIDFRLRSEGDVHTVCALAHEQGALMSVNHPKHIPGCIGCDWDLPWPEKLDAAEVWQGPWVMRNWESLERCDRLLREGRRFTLLGGSDRHQPGYPDLDPAELQAGTPTTWVYADELSVSGILAGITRGRVCVSESPHGPCIDLSVGSAEMGSEYTGSFPAMAAAEVTGAKGQILRWIGPNGVIREQSVPSDPWRDVLLVKEPAGFIRCETAAPDSRQELNRLMERAPELVTGRVRDFFTEAASYPYIRALSNPVFFSSTRKKNRSSEG